MAGALRPDYLSYPGLSEIPPVFVAGVIIVPDGKCHVLPDDGLFKLPF
ncbi:MAG: hypothetical protein IIA50_01625 [Bacteroidetes bacterium]|nr:hypothetical protein [Bacteroidota bacterium]